MANWTASHPHYTNCLWMCEDSTTSDLLAWVDEIFKRDEGCDLYELPIHPENEEPRLFLGSAYHILPLLIFIVDEPADFEKIDRKMLEHALNSLQKYEELLAKIETPSEASRERSRDVGAGFRTLLAAYDASRQLQSSDDEVTSDSWKPFFKSRKEFHSEEEWKFLSRLRELFLRHRQMSKEEVILGLHSLCLGFQPVHLLKSRKAKVIAMHGVGLILMHAGFVANFSFSERISSEVINSTESFLLALNGSSNSNQGLDGHFTLHDVTHTIDRFELLFHQREYDIRDAFDTFRKEIQLKFERSWSETVLWKKLDVVPSAVALMGGEDPVCFVCSTDISEKNFAIMDNCKHLFCHPCIITWFVHSDNCPYCLAKIKTWTTRDTFLATKERKSAGNKRHKTKERAVSE